MCAQILINLNEKLGRYENQHLKRVLGQRDKQRTFRFFQEAMPAETVRVKTSIDKR